MNLSFYRDENTWVHRLDPRTKTIGIMIIFAICLCFNHPLYTTGIMLGVFFTALSAKVLPLFWRIRFILALLFLFSAILWPLFVQGPTILWQWRFLTVSRESLLFGIAMGTRLATFVMSGVILLGTTKNEEITNGLIKMGLPYPVAFALSTALRLVPTFAGAGATIVQAQISRGLDLDSRNIFGRFRKLTPLAIPMFITSIRYTNLLAMALESRGFSPDGLRTLYYEPRMKRQDWIVLFFLSVVLAVFLYLRLALGLGVAMPGRM